MQYGTIDLVTSAFATWESKVQISEKIANLPKKKKKKNVETCLIIMDTYTKLGDLSFFFLFTFFLFIPFFLLPVNVRSFCEYPNSCMKELDNREMDRE